MEITKRKEKEFFKDLICFESEIMNPQEMKKNIDKLVDILNKMKINHKNKVITKVISRNALKKTITMRIHIPVMESQNIQSFLNKYPMYEYLDEFIIKEGYFISISNKMTDFKKAVELFMQKMNESKNVDIEKYDVSKNNIIEVSRIGYDGTVLGFDLYMEWQ